MRAGHVPSPLLHHNLCLAQYSGVCPDPSGSSGSAPRDSKNKAVVVSPRNAATVSGVQPSQAQQFTDVPSRSNRSTVVRSPSAAADTNSRSLSLLFPIIWQEISIVPHATAVTRHPTVRRKRLVWGRYDKMSPSWVRTWHNNSVFRNALHTHWQSAKYRRFPVCHIAQSL